MHFPVPLTASAVGRFSSPRGLRERTNTAAATSAIVPTIATAATRLRMLPPLLEAAERSTTAARGPAPRGSMGRSNCVWWEWVLSQPFATNPVLDLTGEQCANRQRGQVWFLAGSFGSA